MKVELDYKGLLKISSQTDLESYALKKWCEESFNVPDGTVNSEKILVTFRTDREEKSEK